MGNAAIASLERSARCAEEDANRHRQHIEYLTGALSAACEDFQTANASAASCRAAIAKIEAAS